MLATKRRGWADRTRRPATPTARPIRAARWRPRRAPWGSRVLPAGQELWASASPALRAAARAWMRAYARLRRRRELLDQRPAADGLVLLRLVLHHSGVAVGIRRRHLHGAKRSGLRPRAMRKRPPKGRAAFAFARGAHAPIGARASRCARLDDQPRCRTRAPSVCARAHMHRACASRMCIALVRARLGQDRTYARRLAPVTERAMRPRRAVAVAVAA